MASLLIFFWTRDNKGDPDEKICKKLYNRKVNIQRKNKWLNVCFKAASASEDCFMGSMTKCLRLLLSKRKCSFPIPKESADIDFERERLFLTGTLGIMNLYWVSFMSKLLRSITWIKVEIWDGHIDPALCSKINKTVLSWTGLGRKMGKSGVLCNGLKVFNKKSIWNFDEWKWKCFHNENIGMLYSRIVWSYRVLDVEGDPRSWGGRLHADVRQVLHICCLGAAVMSINHKTQLISCTKNGPYDNKNYNQEEIGVNSVWLDVVKAVFHLSKLWFKTFPHGY